MEKKNEIIQRYYKLKLKQNEPRYKKEPNQTKLDRVSNYKTKLPTRLKEINAHFSLLTAEIFWACIVDMALCSRKLSNLLGIKELIHQQSNL